MVSRLLLCFPVEGIDLETLSLNPELISIIEQLRKSQREKADSL